ncbi:tripartite motif protein trim9 [Culex quinquefasciatus]|uniref:Tripartite motif protein trim9 n=1 Tax=Culex quinquefasciatus TaxID=7176 RepID=B0W6Y5_CULQU|nr:tripartite motif protein trim9 [Culex quinquefasciatus]|eukprot:XP_001844469.1 tripartite motif protein trim9 [Culex quinquefasciatus]
MEEELRCPVCKQLFSGPVLLPCYHALCLACAVDIQTTASQVHHAPAIHLHQQHSQSSASSVSTGSSSAPESVSSDQDQADKVSILSEADSGVICCTSRPGSYAGTPNLQGLLFPPSGSGSVFSLACPVCRKIVFFDELGARNLPLYRAMESIVDRFCEREALRCQMCETEPPKVASVICEQCEIRYCDGCRELCHPARGPLAKHTLTKPRGASQLRESICGEHNEPLTMYCMGCKLPICNQCTADNRHQSHDLQSIMAMCKSQKNNNNNKKHVQTKPRRRKHFGLGGVPRGLWYGDEVSPEVAALEGGVGFEGVEEVDALEVSVEMIVVAGLSVPEIIFGMRSFGAKTFTGLSDLFWSYCESKVNEKGNQPNWPPAWVLGPGPGLVHVAKDFKTIDVCLTTLIVVEPVVVWKDQADPAAEDVGAIKQTVQACVTFVLTVGNHIGKEKHQASSTHAQKENPPNIINTDSPAMVLRKNK